MGSYCPDIGMCEPIPCPPGTWVGFSPGKVRCDSCPAGRYCPNVTKTFLCPTSFYCPAGSTQPTPCPPAFFCPLGSNSPKPCPAGFYCPAQTSVQVLCQAGTFCLNGSTVPTPCGPGESSAPGSSACVGTGARRSLKAAAAPVEAREPLVLAGEKTGSVLGVQTAVLVDSAVYAAGSFMILLSVGFVARMLSQPGK